MPARLASPAGRLSVAIDEEFQHTFGILRSVTEQVVEKFLDCGNPLGGFARIRCLQCGHERLLAFSCKGRGFCPSCQGLLDEGVRPGLIIVRQTFGEGARLVGLIPDRRSKVPPRSRSARSGD